MTNILTNHCTSFHSKKFLKYKSAFVAYALISLLLFPCPSHADEPAGKNWEGVVSKNKIISNSSRPIEAAMESHIFFSKEGSSGGNVSGGGGCGCN